MAVIASPYRHVLWPFAVLAVLDGGSAMASTERVYVKDKRDRLLGEGLHALFLEYLEERTATKKARGR